MRRPALLVLLLSILAAVVRRARAGAAEREVWTQATSAPDLR